MKGASELYNLLRNINDKGMGLISVGGVKSVDKDECKAVVSFDGLDIEDVRLKATTDGEKGFKIFPAVGSTVLVQRIADGDYMIIMYSEIEGFEFHIGGKKIELDQDGCLIGNQTDTLLNVINLIIEAIQVIVVIQGKGPDLTKLLQAKTKVENILK
jgi:hypothetical protein